MRRRDFIVVLAGSAAAWPFVVRAQQTRPAKLGVLLVEKREPFSRVFWEGLRELGYIDGQNMQIEYRSAEGKLDRLPTLAAELVDLKVDIIVASETPAVQAAKRATTEIPIVMANIRTAMNRGAFDFLTKPIDFPDLEATIAKTIRHVEDLRDARRRQAEAERAYASLSRYFSPNLVQRLAGDDDAIDLAGQRREIASLFTDIAGFTALVEALEPSVLGPLLNEYLTGMSVAEFKAFVHGESAKYLNVIKETGVTSQ